MTKSMVAGVILMMLAIQYGSCNDFLLLDFDKDSWKDRYYQLEVNINPNDGELDIRINYLNGVEGVLLECASGFNAMTWKTAGDGNPLLRIGSKNADRRLYYFNTEEALQMSNAMSPCQQIAQSNDSMCLFRLRLDVSGSIATRTWMPIYVKIKNYADKNSRSLELFGGSYKPSNGHISNYDAYLANTYAKSLAFSMANVTVANEPNRTLTLNGMNEGNADLISQIKTKYIYFQCPKFSKLVPFHNDEVLRQNILVNLAHLGIPFDKDMMCSFALYFTDVHNELNLIEIKGKELINVRADPRHLDWETEERDELKREYNQLTVKYNNILKILQGVIDTYPMRAAPRMLRSLANPMPGQRYGLKRLLGKIF